MNEIVKVCKVHGELTLEGCVIKTGAGLACRACRKIISRRYSEKNRELLKAKTLQWKIDNPEKYVVGARITKAKYHEKNKEKIKAQRKQYYENNRDKRKAYRFKIEYGITINEYNQMLEQQDRLCKICKNPETVIHGHSKKIKALCVDHDHVTGKVRALLCSKCNCLIGYSQENIAILEEAIRYLKEYE